ncbi:MULTISPECIES: sodium:solute symporter family protein [Dermacoccus]|uniref:sodium:solute symporter family protein n=1 Tax=Dermacoccus TaxID=57495 RepID=UPI0006418B35|nr:MULTISPECIES: sodium:solute symporter family protein [Dermacoccus]KLO62648.1 Na+/galactose cotransporter [Dermacoccus sp. PE3]MBE7371014.1 sodium:solute symporter family protein [Dermacoccus barathri]MBZ4497400.1 sodium:solute symporter family protein [Dermacoccus sp. Tok2021]MCT1985472.1 sodium:solute symporter family protein [Dermacoccus abyssi]QNK51718.1 sodium:solute symporter family protein [Dermacoccus sp. PAMC28757]
MDTSALRLDAGPVDYVLIALYFVFVLGIGLLARRQVSSSIDFFMSGRSLPAWVTGLAFISANLGAVEIMGMSASGAQMGMPTFHYYWIGAIPAMLFLAIVMMPFYYGSGVRSVPEFMKRRFGTGAHLVNAISFALAQVLIAGVNLYLLAKIVNMLLGWDMTVSTIVAAVIVLSYITLGGLSAAIYNEVLQFFVIVAALLPLTLAALHKVGGWGGLQDKMQAAGTDGELASWPGNSLTGFTSSVWSVIGIVFGLGFVLSFGYWTTNFVEVQRVMASKDMNSARRAPIIGTFPKMFIPFIIIIPGIIAGVLVPEIAKAKASGGSADYNNALLYLMSDLLPNGLLGVAIAGMLAAFMAGMAANISAFNTVFSYDIWQEYVVKERDDAYYIRIGRIMTVVATVVAIFTSFLAASYENAMSYLQTLFGFFNAPLFATFILGMFWKRMTATAGWAGLVSGTVGAVIVAVLSEDALGGLSVGVIPIGGQGASFVAAGTAFVVDVLVSYVVSLATQPKPAESLRGLVYSETPKEDFEEDTTTSWWQSPTKLAGISLALVILLNIVFH